MTAAFGSRARIGLILPADNVVMEPELNALALDGVSFHGLRMTSTVHEEMRQQAVDMAATLDEMGVDIAVYACAETSFNGGGDSRETLSAVIASRCSVPVVTATNAMLEALEAVGTRRVSVITPYGARSGRLFEETIAAHGIVVAGAVHRDFSLESDDSREWFATNRQGLATVRDMVLDRRGDDADGVVVAATNIAALGVIDELEQHLGLPVITSNQSILWWCLTRLGVDTTDIPLGRLMRTPAAVERTRS